MSMFWKGTRQEFEGEMSWRATVRRGAKIYFILEREARKFYEYREGEKLVHTVDRSPLDVEELHREVRAGELQVLAGNLPVTDS